MVLALGRWFAGMSHRKPVRRLSGAPGPSPDWKIARSRQTSPSRLLPSPAPTPR